MIFLIIWAALAFMMQKEYTRTLLNILFSTKTNRDKESRKPIDIEQVTETENLSAISFDAIIKLSESHRSSDREQAAYLLGQSGRYYAYKYIIKLLDDNDVRVQIAAIRSSRQIKRTELIPYLMTGISSPQLQLETKETLIVIGEPIIEHVNSYFNRYDGKADIIAILIDIIETIGSPKAIRFLRAKLTHSSNEVTMRVMEALTRLNYTPNQGEESYLITQIDAEINAYLWIVSAENDLKDSVIRDSLFNALKDERKKSMLKILTILSFFRGDNQFKKIEELIYGSYSQTKSYLADLVSLLIKSDEIKSRVLTLFENISDFEILLKYESRYPQQKLSTENRLLTIINKDNLNAVTKALALKELLQYHDENTIKILAANVKTENVLLAEAALYGLAKSNPERFSDISDYFKAKNDRKYIELCKKVAAFESENDLTISNVEFTADTGKLVT
ncbi:hypothetical protein GCM10027085_56550 [Spirosoma aerophilum]